MLKKFFITVSVATIFLSTFMIAQEENELEEGIVVPQKNMEAIASDSGMRIEIIDLILEKCQGNNDAMIEVGNTIIRNPEMHKIMKELLNNEVSIKVEAKPEGNTNETMIMESTERMEKPKYDSYKK